MSGRLALVAGTGHLGDRLEQLIRETRPVVRVDPVQLGSLRAFEAALETAGIATAATVYIVDDRDAANIQFVLAALKLRPDLPITMAISNERLVPHLQGLDANLVVVNPWESVAPEIVKALREPASSTVTSAAALPLKPQTPLRMWLHHNAVLLWLVMAFVVLIGSATIFLHQSEELDWITAFYFVVTMGTTTGFGDINLRNSSVAAKLVGMLTMLSGIAFVSVFFSLLLERIVARRTELLLGHRRHALKGHVVVCGLGRLGYHLVQKLQTDAYPVLVIDKDAENRFLPAVREMGISVMIADVTLPKTLLNAAVDRASAVASIVDDDLVNLEVGLNARAIHPNIRVILRIFDRDTAEELRHRIHIHYAISTSSIAARAMLDRSDRQPQAR